MGIINLILFGGDPPFGCDRDDGKTPVILHNVRLVRDTPKAGLFIIPDKGEQWLPWSQVKFMGGDLELPEWLYDKIK